MRNCKKCGKLIFDRGKRKHKCPPLWRCWFADRKDDTLKEVHAHDLHEAATQYVRAWDNGEASSELTMGIVIVWAVGRGGHAEKIASRFQVIGEWVPSYHAERIGAGPLL